MSTFDSIWKRLGGRKLLAFFLGLVALVVLALTGHLTETAMYGILGLAASFSGGNIGEHIAGAIAARAKRPAPPEQLDAEADNE
jgi:hypothetical protein